MPRAREVLIVCRRWVAGEPTLPLADQLFHTLTALAGLLCLFVVIPANFFQNISPWVNRGVFGYAVISLATSWMATRGRYFRKSYVACLVCLLDLIWFPNAGSHASIGLYFFPTALLIIALFESRWRILGVVLLVIDLFALHVVEWLKPQLLVPFTTQTDRFVDLSIGYAISLGMCVVILDVMVKGFHLERTRSLDAMQALAEKESERRQYELQALRNERTESLGVLAGGVAHDMNNVLGAIMGLTSVHLAQAPSGSVLHNDLATIMKACQRGGAMVRGLLGLAREGLPVENDVDLNVVVRDAVMLLERTTLQKVTLQVELESALYRLNGDQVSLAHALMNVCVNAVDAMPNGGTLTIRTMNGPDSSVMLEVIDTGFGMSEEVRNKALDPFFTTKPIGRGTGLGLPIVFGTVKAHRGRLEIQSELARGTQVRMVFPGHPLATSDGEDNDGPVSIRITGKLNVLLVDDDELVQHAVKRLLKCLGHRVTSVSSGASALEAVQAGLAPDLVVLDMNMPDLDGAATLSRLRALIPNVPVVLATGRADQNALDLAASQSLITILPKPFGAQELSRKVESLVLKAGS